MARRTLRQVIDRCSHVELSLKQMYRAAKRDIWALIPRSLGRSMGYRTDPNPDKLTQTQILEKINFCPICGAPWPKGKQVCSCGVKVRVEPKAYNWWMFYPKHNEWNLLRD